MTAVTPNTPDPVAAALCDALRATADRWEAEAAVHVRRGAQHRADHNDQMAAWSMACADTSHWCAQTLARDRRPLLERHRPVLIRVSSPSSEETVTRGLGACDQESERCTTRNGVHHCCPSMKSVFGRGLGFP